MAATGGSRTGSHRAHRAHSGQGQAVDACRVAAGLRAWRVDAVACTKEPWPLPAAVSAIDASAWTDGPDGLLYFVGRDPGPDVGTSLYQWRPGTPEPVRLVLPEAPLAPFDFGHGRNAVDLAAEAMEAWWSGRRAQAGW